MSRSFRDTLNQQLSDDLEFKKEFEALIPEYEFIKALIDSRKAKNLTQKELAEKTGINQADISKIERGNANPSLKTIRRIADAMDMYVKIELIPKNSGKNIYDTSTN
ncbi:MAG: helix-turn-helix transcriptional regulator [Firmicutes bacterium]|jgi:transcriptional regulator, XRE family|nr:helix-turn-helix transcriptional regulator [Bacillota bacterium]MBQ9604645.1 helix-turn-helix transcriptional regulator [Bacillota bacterium]